MEWRPSPEQGRAAICVGAHAPVFQMGDKQMAEGVEVPPHFLAPRPHVVYPSVSVDSKRNSLVILLKNYLAFEVALATGYLQTR